MTSNKTHDSIITIIIRLYIIIIFIIIILVLYIIIHNIITIIIIMFLDNIAHGGGVIGTRTTITTVVMRVKYKSSCVLRLES